MMSAAELVVAHPASRRLPEGADLHSFFIVSRRQEFQHLSRVSTLIPIFYAAMFEISLVLYADFKHGVKGHLQFYTKNSF